jgi:hypothetical protein
MKPYSKYNKAWGLILGKKGLNFGENIALAKKGLNFGENMA